MKLELKPIIKSMVVCVATPEKTNEFHANIETSYIYNLTIENLRMFVVEAMQPLIKTDNIVKLSSTLEYTVGDTNHLYQVIITDKGFEEFSSNKDFPIIVKK